MPAPKVGLTINLSTGKNVNFTTASESTNSRRLKHFLKYLDILTGDQEILAIVKSY